MNKSIQNKINGYFQKYKNVFSNTNIRSSNLNTNQDTPQQNEVASHEAANAMRNQVIANSNISINNSNQTIQTNNEGISNQQKLPENEKDLLSFIEDAVCNSKDLDNETIKTLLDNKHLGIISNPEHKNVYLCNLAKTTMQTKKAIKSDTIQILLNNIGNIDDDAKNEYLYNLAIAASKNTINENTLSQLSWTASKTSNLNNATILMLLTNTERINNIDLKNNSLCSIAKAASQTLNLDNDTIQKLLNNIGNIDDDDAKNEYLNNLSKAASQTLNLNDETIKTLISKDNISLIKNKDDYLCNISIATANIQNLDNTTISTLLDEQHLDIISSQEKKREYLYNIAKAASKTQNLDNNTIQKLLNNIENINNGNKDGYLGFVAQAASKNKIDSFTIYQLAYEATTIPSLTNTTLKTLFKCIEKIEKKKDDSYYINYSLLNMAEAASKTQNIDYDIIQKLLDNIRNIDDGDKDGYLCNLAIAASKTPYLNNTTINTLLDEQHLDIISSQEKKRDYLYYLAIAASQNKNLNDETIKILLKNIGNIDDGNKDGYLGFVAQAVSKNKIDSYTVYYLSDTAAKTPGLTDTTITTILESVEKIDDNKNMGMSKNDCLPCLAEAASQTQNLNDETIKTLISKDNISLIKNKDEYLQSNSKS